MMVGAMRRPTGHLATAAFGGILVAALALAVRLGPALALALPLALPSTERALVHLIGDPTREDLTLPGADGPLRADLYRPAAPQGALLLVHGLSPAGRRHPDLARLARLLARHGRLVLVPDFEGLRAFRLSGREVDEVGQALRHLRRMDARVGVAGFSFGAGPALLAAATVPDLRLVGSFGGYADLRHVIAFITTGVHAFDGRRYAQPQEEYNRWKLLALLAGFVEDARDRALLQAIAERRLADPAEATGRMEAGLGAEGRSVLALVQNRREDALPALLAGLPAPARDALERLSPLAVVPRLSGRLLVAHGVEDGSIPFTESLRLAEASGGRARTVIFRTFHHTGPQPLWRSLADRARDGWQLLRLADALLTG